MLTAERIQEYTSRGYSPRKLIKSNNNTAKNWQVKTAMGQIDPKDYDEDLMGLPAAVWRLAEQIRDNEEVEKHISNAKAAAKVIKFRQKYEDWKSACIIMGVLWVYTASLAIIFYFTRM